MLLYLVRHGDAVAEKEDPARPLSAKGRERAEKLAAFLKRNEVKADEIWHSTKLRARQTAEIVAEAISQDNLSEKKILGPNDPVMDVIDKIYEIEENLMIVGHLPFIPALVSQLLLNDESCEIVKLAAAGAICLEHTEDEGWEIRWLVSPDLL